MKRLSLTLMLLAGAAMLHAEEPGNIYLPGSEDLDDAGKALYARANDDVKKSYHALLDKNDGVEAERLMQEALALIGTLTAQIGDAAPGGNKVGIYGNARKNRNVVETSGGLDGIAEMEMKNLTTVTDYDFHLHHRAVLANFTSQVKNVKALQEYIIKKIYAAGNTKSYTGSQTERDKSHKQQPKTDQDKQDDTPTGMRRLAVNNQAQPQDPDQQQKNSNNGQQSQNALLSNPKQQQNQAKPGDAKPDDAKTGDAKDANGKPQTNQDNKLATPPGATPPTPPQLPAGAKAPNAAGAPNPGQPNTNPDGSPNQDPNTPETNEELAQKQDQVARKLDTMAEQLRQQGGQQDSANAFRHAADAAKDAAAAIRSNDKNAAASAAAAAQKAMDIAFATVRGQGDLERQQQTAALASAVTGIQDRQAQVVTDAKKLKDAIAAGTVSKEDARAQGVQLANRQADIKQDIDALGKGIDTLAQSAPDTTSPSSQAVQEGLKAAANALHEGRAPQEAVNATINLEQGHTDQALGAIARETKALDQAQARLNAAADAAAGGHGSDRQALGDLQRLSTALRQLAKTTQAAIDGAQQHDAKKPDQAGQDDQKNGDQGKTTTANKEEAHANGAPPGELPAELGNAIDANMLELSKQVDEQMKNMPQASAEQKARISALTRQRAPIAKDPGATLEHMSSLVAEVEGLEVNLSKRISQDQGHAALETFLKDPVPAAYRASVADYYQLLADDMSMSSSSTVQPVQPAKVTP